MKLFILMSLICNLLFDLTAGHPQRNPEDLTVDLGRCKPETRSFSWGLGSESFVVKGRRGKKCIFQHTSELEGGYTKSECRVPVSLGKLTMSEGCRPDVGDYGNRCGVRYSVDIARYCKVTQAGNFFFETRPH